MESDDEKQEETSVSNLLKPLENIDLDSISSWSEIELYASIYGVDVDRDFFNAVFRLSVFYDNMLTALLESLVSPAGEIDKLANSMDFVECVFGLNDVDNHYKNNDGYFEIIKWLQTKAAGKNINILYSSKAKKIKYATLAVLYARFPYLLVKFFARHFKYVNTVDAEFSEWIMARLRKASKTDSALAPVVMQFELAISDMLNLTMFKN